MKPIQGEDIPRLLNELRQECPNEVNILKLREGTGISHGSAQNAFDYEKFPKNRDIQDRIIAWITSFYVDSIYDSEPYDLMAEGDVHLKSGFWRDALESYARGLAQVTDRELERELQVKAAQACISLRRKEDAESYIQSINMDGSEYWVGRVSLLRGALNYAEGYWPRAKTELSEAVEILSKHNEPNAVMNAIMRLIGISYYSEDLDGARRWIIQALGLASKTESAGRVATLYGQSAKIALVNNDLDDARYHIDKGLQLAEKINSVHTASLLRTLNGKLYQRLGDIQEALNQYYVAWWYNQSSGCQDRNVWLMSSMAEAQLAMGNTGKAETLSKEALDLAESLPSVRLPEALFARAQVLNNPYYAYRAIDAAEGLQQSVKIAPIEAWLANGAG